MAPGDTIAIRVPIRVRDFLSGLQSEGALLGHLEEDGCLVVAEDDQRLNLSVAPRRLLGTSVTHSQTIQAVQSELACKHFLGLKRPVVSRAKLRPARVVPRSNDGVITNWRKRTGRDPRNCKQLCHLVSKAFEKRPIWKLADLVAETVVTPRDLKHALVRLAEPIGNDVWQLRY